MRVPRMARVSPAVKPLARTEVKSEDIRIVALKPEIVQQARTD